jgi:hypothetical protein
MNDIERDAKSPAALVSNAKFQTHGTVRDLNRWTTALGWLVEQANEGRLKIKGDAHGQVVQDANGAWRVDLCLELEAISPRMPPLFIRTFRL